VKIDLHVHTTASDGTESPAHIVELALEAGLAAVAVTDHDTADGCREALEAGERLGLEVVPGIELSTKFHASVHILGYYIDAQSPHLLPVLEWMVNDRNQRNRRIAELMASDGLPVSYDEMQRRFSGVIGRPHFAELLVEFGLAEDVSDAFRRFMNRGEKYYIGRSFLPLDRSIEIILLAGGVPVLAHPFQYRMDDAELRELIEYCIGKGLRGMECRYSGYRPDQVAYLEKLAAEYGLIRTGGSDFHGTSKPHIRIGSGTGALDVPCRYLEELKTAAGR